jgi:chromosome segregation ATPase
MKNTIEELREEIVNIEQQIEDNTTEINKIQCNGSYFIPELFEEDFEQDFDTMVFEYVDNQCIYYSDCKDIVEAYLEDSNDNEDIFDLIKEYNMMYGIVPDGYTQLAAYVLETSCKEDCEEDFNTIKELIDENNSLKEDLSDLEDELSDLETELVDLEYLEQEEELEED